MISKRHVLAGYMIKDNRVELIGSVRRFSVRVFPHDLELPCRNRRINCCQFMDDDDDVCIEPPLSVRSVQQSDERARIARLHRCELVPGESSRFNSPIILCVYSSPFFYIALVSLTRISKTRNSQSSSGCSICFRNLLTIVYTTACKIS